MNFESFLDQNSSSFIRFQCILHGSGVLFSKFWNYYKFRRGTWFLGIANLAEYLNYLVALLYFNFKSFLDPTSSWFIRFRSVVQFLPIKECGSNFWGEAILQNVWIITSPLLYFNFKSFLDPTSSSLIRFLYILHDLRVLFSELSNFYKLKRGGGGGSNFCGETILQEVWTIWSPLLYFNFKSFLDPNSLSFIRFQCILDDSRVLFSELSNFYKLKRGDLISGGNQIWRKSQLFGSHFCISILKIL